MSGGLIARGDMLLDAEAVPTYGCPNLYLYDGWLEGALTESQFTMLCLLSERSEYEGTPSERFYTSQFSLPIVLAKNPGWHQPLWQCGDTVRLYLTTGVYNVRTIPPEDRPPIAFVLGELKQFFQIRTVLLLVLSPLRLFTSGPGHRSTR